MKKPERIQIYPDEYLLKILSAEQFGILRKDGTESPFDNAFWNNHEEGIYVDAVSGQVLFSSSDKFDSGTGWPSFTKPVFKEALVLKTDLTHGMMRTEVRAALSDIHLGHVFNDGPKPLGQRYCMNSAAFRFVSQDALEAGNYGHYAWLFGGSPSIVFAAGCFWAVEEAFAKMAGVVGAASGYIGGHVVNPTYEDVCTGKTGHAEAVRVDFDPEAVGEEALLKKFWAIHDPTSLNRQGPDAGTQYRSAIFATGQAQLDQARKSREEIGRSGLNSRPVVTEILPAGPFFRAEEYHQRYLEKRKNRHGF